MVEVDRALLLEWNADFSDDGDIDSLAPGEESPHGQDRAGNGRRYTNDFVGNKYGSTYGNPEQPVVPVCDGHPFSWYSQRYPHLQARTISTVMVFCFLGTNRGLRLEIPILEYWRLE
jgi:hypothetical protein